MKTQSPQSNKELLKALLALEEENEKLRAELEEKKSELDSIAMKSEYPLVLKASHVAAIMDIAEPTAYAMMRRTDFPSFVPTGKSGGNVRVYRDHFFGWLEGRTRQLA